MRPRSAPAVSSKTCSRREMSGVLAGDKGRTRGATAARRRLRASLSSGTASTVSRPRRAWADGARGRPASRASARHRHRASARRRPQACRRAHDKSNMWRHGPLLCSTVECNSTAAGQILTPLHLPAIPLIHRCVMDACDFLSRTCRASRSGRSSSSVNSDKRSTMAAMATSP